MFFVGVHQPNANVKAHHFVELCMQSMNGLPPWYVVLLKRFNAAGFTYLAWPQHMEQIKKGSFILAGSRRLKCFYCRGLFVLWRRPGVCRCSTCLKVWAITTCVRSRAPPQIPKSGLIVFSAEPPVWALSWHNLYPEIPWSFWTRLSTFQRKSDVCAVWRLLVNMWHDSLRF